MLYSRRKVHFYPNSTWFDSCSHWPKGKRSIPYSFGIILCISMMALWSCQTEPPQAEDIVREYVAALAASDFAQASRLSTPRHMAYLEALAAVIGDDPPAADSAWIEIETIVCEARNTGAYCTTIERDPYETTEKEYWLVQQGTMWYIDRPPEDGQLEHREEQEQ